MRPHERHLTQSKSHPRSARIARTPSPGHARTLPRAGELDSPFPAANPDRARARRARAAIVSRRLVADAGANYGNAFLRGRRSPP